MKKIKSFMQAVSVMAMTVPALVSAQFDPSAGGGTGLPSNPISNIIENIMYWILGLVGIIGVIGFAIAGIMYLTAAGDDGRIETAKKAMLYSIIGVIVALLGLVILRAANQMLRGNSTF